MRRWLNMYRAGDPIGRGLSFSPANVNTQLVKSVPQTGEDRLHPSSGQGSEQRDPQAQPACPQPENRLIGNGGHFDYFRDDEVARQIMAWITSPETPFPLPRTV